MGCRRHGSVPGRHLLPSDSNCATLAGPCRGSYFLPQSRAALQAALLQTALQPVGLGALVLGLDGCASQEFLVSEWLGAWQEAPPPTP